MRPLPGRLLVVTDRHQTPRSLQAVVADAIAGGARWIWLRDRDLAPEGRRMLAQDLRRLTASAGASLTVGADPALAAEVGADGVHVGAGREGVVLARKRLGPEAIVGVSAHSLREVAEARDGGADYATLSPIFPSASKPGYGPALGPEALREATALNIPVLALGGVTIENARDCLAAGAAGIAVMGAIMRAEASGDEVVLSLLAAMSLGTA